MKKFIAFVLASTPLFASAQLLTDINSVAQKATNIGNLVIGLAIAFAVLWIIISIVRYLIAGSADEEKRKAGQNAIVYGVVGLFLILSIWGLVAILKRSFQTNDTLPDNDINRTTTLPRPDYVP